MEAEDTVMSRYRAHSIWNKAWHKDNAFNYYDASLALAQAQAKVTFPLGEQVGIKEAGEWLGKKMVAVPLMGVEWHIRLDEIEALKRGEIPEEAK